jgi:hypothetical protein
MRFWVGGSRAGLKAGVSIDLTGFFRSLWRTMAPGNRMIGSFVYVISGEHGMVKVGVSTDPNTRIADLQTGSPFRLQFELIGMTTGQGYDIESLAHEMLDKHRAEGEWFAVPAAMAIAAVHAAAHELGHELTIVPQQTIDSIITKMQPARSARLTPAGYLISCASIAAAAAAVTIYDDHFISVAIVTALIAVIVVKPILLRFFVATTEP